MRSFFTFTFTFLWFLLSQFCNCKAAYVLQDDYGNSASFFDKFTFFTDPDPTHGFVKYVDRATAQNTGLISAVNGVVRMDVEHNLPAPNGRNSVRLTSTRSYNHGLFVVDLAHMPGGICGTWPAFWLVGPDWPNNGEIDILEGVNQQSQNSITLHTSDGCKITTPPTEFTGNLITSNCFVNAPNQPANAGCTIQSTSPQSYGNGFNAIGGGVYATEWNSEGISIWIFPRQQQQQGGNTTNTNGIPPDLVSGNPDPRGWGPPAARFRGDCNWDAHFRDMQIVFDTTFCGDWAANVWSSSSCASVAPTCQQFVAENPGAFKEAFWAINWLKVYRAL